MFRLSLALIAASVAGARELDLSTLLTPSNLAQCPVKNAAISRDPATGALTFTFHAVDGEPEVRIPVRALGWPADWSDWRSVQYTFQTSSVEPLSIGFDDGRAVKAFLTEPLPGIRIAGVILFEAFVQTRSMTPLLPLGYKVWLDRLFTFKNVEHPAAGCKGSSTGATRSAITPSEGMLTGITWKTPPPVPTSLAFTGSRWWMTCRPDALPMKNG